MDVGGVRFNPLKPTEYLKRFKPVSCVYISGFLPAKMIYWTKSKKFSKDESFTHINKHKNIRNGFKNTRIPLYYANAYAERLTEDRR